jgi:hypothetical protein
VHSFDDLWVDPVTLQFVVNVNPLDDQNLALELDLTSRLTGEPAIACVYLARLQRAPEGSRQSAAGGGNNVVERGGIGRRIPGINAVVLRYLRMDSKGDRTLPCGKEGLPHRALVSYDSHLRGVNDVTHQAPPRVS